MERCVFRKNGTLIDHARWQSFAEPTAARTGGSLQSMTWRPETPALNALPASRISSLRSMTWPCLPSMYPSACRTPGREHAISKQERCSADRAGAQSFRRRFDPCSPPLPILLRAALADVATGADSPCSAGTLFPRFARSMPASGKARRVDPGPGRSIPRSLSCCWQVVP